MKLPKLTGTISPAFLFLLVSVTTRSWSETVIIAAILGFRTMSVASETAAMAIAGGAACGGADVVALVIGWPVQRFSSHSLIVSAILCLLREAPFYPVWRSIQLSAVPYFWPEGPT